MDLKFNLKLILFISIIILYYYYEYYNKTIYEGATVDTDKKIYKNLISSRDIFVNGTKLENPISLLSGTNKVANIRTALDAITYVEMKNAINLSLLIGYIYVNVNKPSTEDFDNPLVAEKDLSSTELLDTIGGEGKLGKVGCPTIIHYMMSPWIQFVCAVCDIQKEELRNVNGTKFGDFTIQNITSVGKEFVWGQGNTEAVKLYDKIYDYMKVDGEINITNQISGDQLSILKEFVETTCTV